MNYIAEHRSGFIGTLVTHGVLLLLLVFFGAFKENHVQFDEGILVNFGDSETGFGLEEPAPGEREPGINPAVSAVEKSAVAPPATKKNAAEADDEVITQEIEKTVALGRQKEIIDREKQLEAERLKKEELIRQQKEQQLQAQAAAEQRRIGEINSRAKNVFGGGGKGSPDSKSTSQGITYGAGNQGVPQGSANAERYGPGGGIGNGVSFSLDGRTALSLPKPYYPGNEEGVVVVQVTVDKMGAVTKAEAGARGSNTVNPELIAAAKKAALQAKFNVDSGAPAFQTGSITYRFVLD